MGYYNDKYKIAYLAHPRTASQATAKALVEQLNFVNVHDKSTVGFGHHDTLDKDRIDDGWIVFSTVRNHFDTIVSWWFFDRRKQPLDKHFIQQKILDRREYPDENRLFGLHSDDCTDIVRYELLNSAVDDIFSRKGLSIKIPWYNVDTERNSAPYHLFFDAQTRQFIQNQFKDEMQKLGYTWK